MKTIGLVLPFIRPNRAKLVIKNLYNQTLRPKKIIAVDNGSNIDSVDIQWLSKGFHLICPGQNIGCNAVWNMMWDLKTDYVGAVSDDLSFDPFVIEALTTALDMQFTKRKIGIATASVYRTINDFGYSVPRTNLKNIEGNRVKKSKGSCGLFLMRRCTIECIPPIPDVFFNYYGDNYFGYWMNILDLDFIVINAFVVHHHSLDIEGEKKLYKKPVKSELGHWKAYIRGEADYSP